MEDFNQLSSLSKNYKNDDQKCNHSMAIKTLQLGFEKLVFL